VGLIIKDSSTKNGISKESAKKAIQENDITLILVPNDKYSEKINDIAEISAKLGEKVLYVSANKPYPTLIKNFEKSKIDTNKFFFIDCVTKNAAGSEAGGRVTCVSSPKALTEMNIAMKKVLEANKPGITVFDSLSTLLIYEDSSVVTRFVHSIISVFRSVGSKGVLISLKDEVKNELIKDLSMFVDKVIEME
jgi:KaiC/GvpD/RAD55 family RecA-like ATPase